MPTPSTNLKKLPPYLFAELDRKIADKKSQGIDIISLGVGDPDLPTPQPIIDALTQAAQDPSTHQYPAYQGSSDFRQDCATWMKTRFGVEVCAESETLAVIGAKEGLAHLILAYIQPGDVVLCPSPAYPVYHNYTVLCGGEPVTVAMKPENNFLVDFSSIDPEVAQKAKILFLNYPNNPTGAIATPEFAQEAVDFCKKYDILLCHDNAYSEMTYGDYKAPSFLSANGAKDVCLEMFSMSKMFNMTGWRVGFAVGNKDAINALGTIKNNTDSGVFTAIQRAAAEGLKDSDALVAPLNKIYGKRCELFVQGLKDLGWDIEPMVATFYLWAPVPTGMTSETFATKLLEDCGIVVPPGSGYGSEGEGFFRVALTQPEAQLNEALKRMRDKNITWDALAISACTV